MGKHRINEIQNSALPPPVAKVDPPTRAHMRAVITDRNLHRQSIAEYFMSKTRQSLVQLRDGVEPNRPLPPDARPSDDAVAGRLKLDG